MSEYKEVPGLSGIKLTYVDSVAEADALISWLGERRETDFIAMDTETTGLNEYAADAKVRLVQIGDMHTGWAFRWDRWAGLFFEVMDKWDKGLVLHNAQYDIRYMEANTEWKAPWERIHDTMIMSQVDKSDRRSHALKQLSNSMIDRRASMGQQMLEEEMKTNGWGWADVPFTSIPYTTYSAMDVVLTAQLAYSLDTPNRYAEAYDLEMATLRVCTQMSQAGSRVDLEYSHKKKAELEEYSDKIRKWGYKQYSTNLASNAQLVRLFESLGAEIVERTPKNAPSVNKTQLQIFMNDGRQPEVQQLANLVSNMKKAEKLATTYFENFINGSVDGFIHPQIKTLAARTSRMSVVNPAAQTLPSNDATVRRAIIPRTEDEKILTIDYDQIESRLMAHYSGDENLIKAFEYADATGDNFFVPFGQGVFKDTNFSKNDPRYKVLKSAWYGGLYGASPYKQALTAGVPLEDMEIIAAGINESYPNIKKFQNTVIAAGDKRQSQEGQGYVTLADGRKLRSDRDMSYTLCNYILQGSAAVCLKKALVNLDHAGFGKYMLMPVHDEVLFSVPENECAEALKEMTEIMTYRDGYRVPLTAGPEGPYDSWGSKYKETALDMSYVDVLDFKEDA